MAGFVQLVYRVVIDLHTHSILSDGALVPAELVRRAEVAGYRAIALTDHADDANLAFVVEAAVRAAEALNGETGVILVPGVELTHIPPRKIQGLVERARSLGARWVVVHGETLAEPVIPGTNRAALEAGCDLLSHPGLISEEDAALARERGVALELSARKGHCLANGHVARMALRAGAIMIVNTDAHEPGDLISRAFAASVALGAGLGADDVETVLNESAHRVRNVMPEHTLR